MSYKPCEFQRSAGVAALAIGHGGAARTPPDDDLPASRDMPPCPGEAKPDRQWLRVLRILALAATSAGMASAEAGAAPHAASVQEPLYVARDVPAVRPAVAANAASFRQSVQPVLPGAPARPVQLAQASTNALLPSLALPPATTTAPATYVSMMQLADSAMVRGDIMRARALYERAAANHPRSAAACIAAGKTYDPNILQHFGGSVGFADVARARDWYERARALGDPHAAALLASLR